MITGLEKSLIKWLSAYSSIIPEISAEMVGKKNGLLLFQMGDGPTEISDYVYSGKVRRTEFKIRIRVSHSDTASRLDAIHILDTVGQICSQTLPELSGGLALKAGVSEHPKLKRRTDNGDDEYETVCFVTYWEENI